MYICESCHRDFAVPKRVREHYGMPYPWYQEFDACPRCGVVGVFLEVTPREE